MPTRPPYRHQLMRCEKCNYPLRDVPNVRQFVCDVCAGTEPTSKLGAYDWSKEGDAKVTGNGTLKGHGKRRRNKA